MSHVAPRRPALPARRLRAVALAATVALVGLAAPIVTGTAVTSAAAAPTAGAYTVTGSRSGDHAYDPATKTPFAATPSVTVDQVDNLTDQVVHVTWQNFTPSTDRQGHVVSSYNPGNTFYAVTVLQCRGLDPAAPAYRAFDFGPDCYNFAANNAFAASGVGNQSYTLTGTDGSGETYLHIETSAENSKLGCNVATPCSLVVVPNWGGVQPSGQAPGASGVDCSSHKRDTKAPGTYAVDSDLGFGCSWNDRFVVPLHFAPTPSNCPSKSYAFAAEGAPMLARTMQQWTAAWCNGAHGVTFDYDSGTNEYLARQSFLGGSGALTSSTDVAIVNRPVTSVPAGARPFTYAPLTNSGIAVAYHVDNQQTGQLIDNLTLNAELVAKLLTQSYALDFGCTTGASSTVSGPNCDPAVKGNPVDIFDDPQFQALNKEYPRTDFPAISQLNRGQFMPLVLSGDSDMTYQLTNWIESDPQAKAFLAGTPDPKNADGSPGMHVNTYYKDETMPLDEFQTLDPGYTAPASNGVPGESTMQVTWNPITGLDNVTSSLVIDRPSAIDPTLPQCDTSGGNPCVYGRFSSQLPGTRALFAVVGLADAAADRFPTAQLVNAAGKAVGPTSVGLAAAQQQMTTNPDNITQTAGLRSTNPAQYPLTVTDYAMVPTCGVPAAKASAVKQFLSDVTSSQTYGSQPGQLAVGNLALTGRQLGQTRAAAAAVSTGACPRVRSGSPTAPGSTGPNGHNGSPHGSNDPSSAGSSSTGAASDTGAGGSAPNGTPGTGKATDNSTHPTKTLAAFGVKRSDSGANPGVILPVLLVLTAMLLIGGPGAMLLLGTSQGAAALRRVRSGSVTGLAALRDWRARR